MSLTLNETYISIDLLQEIRFLLALFGEEEKCNRYRIHKFLLLSKCLQHRTMLMNHSTIRRVKSSCSIHYVRHKLCSLSFALKLPGRQADRHTHRRSAPR